MTPSLYEAYNFLLLNPDSGRIRKLLTHYEIFKKAMCVPGDIVECGVFKGAGFMYWLKLLDLYARGEYRKVIGFDTFSEFSKSLLDYEKVNAKRQCWDAKFEGIDPENILDQAKAADLHNCELVKGDVIETIPKYVKENTGFRISLLHLDLDAYLGTKTALENLYDLVTPGGIILLDEYGIRGWGESDAVDEFIKDKDITIHSIRGSYQPTAYIVK